MVYPAPGGSRKSVRTQMGFEGIRKFIESLFEGDLHAMRVYSLANATLGVLSSASLAVHLIGQGPWRTAVG